MKKYFPLVFSLVLLLVCLGQYSHSKAGSEFQVPGSKFKVPGSLSTPAISRPAAYFTPNQGQFHPAARYYTRTPDYTVWLTKTGLVFDRIFEKPVSRDPEVQHPEKEIKDREVTRLLFMNANPEPEMAAADGIPHRVNYLRGNDPAAWFRNINTYATVWYRGLYPDIDLKVYFNQGNIEYDWVVHPGADPGRLQFKYQNVESVEIDPEGNLVFTSRLGRFVHKKPLVFQTVNGKHTTRIASFEKSADGNIQFDVSDYDPSIPLIIDPVVMGFSSYLGGNGKDVGMCIDVDDNGNVYAGGYTASSNFPSQSSYQGSYQGGNYDAFVSKLTSQGDSLTFSTYLGGSDKDRIWEIKVDGHGNIFAVGDTESSDFPTLNAYDSGLSGSQDGFVSKLTSAGSSLSYSTYLGGSDGDSCNAIDVVEGYAYVTGSTHSENFPTLSAYQSSHGSPNSAWSDAFITKFNPAGNSLVYSTYLGGNGSDSGHDIKVRNGKAYIVGTTGSSDYPTQNAFQDTYVGGGYFDAMVTCLGAAGNSLYYSTYLGGNYNEFGRGIDVGSLGYAFVTGSTESTDFPTQNAYQPNKGGGGFEEDAFLTRFSIQGSTLSYSTYLGGSGIDIGFGIRVDENAKAYVAGYTSSSNFPLLNPIQGNQSSYDIFVTKFSGTASRLEYSTYLGGSGDDRCYGMALDGNKNVYLVGKTASTDFPVLHAYQGTNGGGDSDAFFGKVTRVKDDLLGSWPGQGVYYRNFDSNNWTYIGTPASQVCCGDLDNDWIDDLIGIWPGQGGVWALYSGSTWNLLANTATWIASGDMSGDGRDDLLGSWTGQGVYYLNMATMAWVHMASEASQVIAGDLDGDGIDDLIGIWTGQGGVWVKYSSTGNWALLASTADWIAVGDMNGDGRVDLLGTWSGQGTYYLDTLSGGWVQMASEADQVAAGDLNGDGSADLIGIWSAQGGVWVKYTGFVWLPVATTADWIASGKMRVATNPAQPIILQQGEPELMNRLSENTPMIANEKNNFSQLGPGGQYFVFSQQKNSRVGDKLNQKVNLHFQPGPGLAGFYPEIEPNIMPRENEDKKRVTEKIIKK